MGEQFERVAGMRAMSSMDWDLSNLPELLLGEFSRGAATTISGFADIGADLTFNIANQFYRGISGEDYFTDKELKDWKKDAKKNIKAAGDLAVASIVSMDDPMTMFQEGKFTINKEGKVVLGGGLVGQQTVDKFNEEGIIAEGITGLLRSAPDRDWET